MSLSARIGVALLSASLSALLLGTMPGCQSPAARSTSTVEASAVTAPRVDAPIVAFASDEGMARLSRSTAKADFAPLANQFEAQLNGAFCGPTSAAIVLNTVRNQSPDLPRDHDRLRPDDLRNIPSGFDPIVPRYTQDNVIVKGAKTRAQVLGEPIVVDGKSMRDFGYQLKQFEQMLSANGLLTRAVVVTDDKPESEVRSELVATLSHPGSFAVVNFRREAIGQKGGGHISPLAAYDARTDSFLMLDVNPAAAGWSWLTTATLVKGMRTFDTVENRGYVIVSAP